METKVEVRYAYHTKSRGWEWKRGSYAHRTSLDLAVGDVVLVPFFGTSDTQLAVVTKLDTDYTGPLERVVRRATAEEKEEMPVYVAGREGD